MQDSGLTSAVVFQIGPIAVTTTVVTTWCIMVALAAVSALSTRNLQIQPGRLQAAVEGIVELLRESVHAVAGQHTMQLIPFIGTLWLFLIVANLTGLIPGAHSPTRDLSATAAFAFLVFLSVHWFGIRCVGIKNYLRHYVSPSPILLPFHLISEVSRTLALALRLFGNIMSLELAALLVLLVAGFLAPVPILMLHIIEALVQAYIFGMLALIYIASGLQSQQLRLSKEE